MNVSGFLAGVLPFAIAMSFTPGPNNLLLASAGARFGFARTWRHQLGIVVGFAIMMLCVGFGIAALIAAVPAIYTGMKIASIAYILYLAWRIGTAEAASPDGTVGSPMGFLAAAGFQWINPKAWIMTLTAVATYTDAEAAGAAADPAARADVRGRWRGEQFDLGRVRAAYPATSDLARTASRLQPDDGGPARRLHHPRPVRAVSRVGHAQQRRCCGFDQVDGLFAPGRRRHPCRSPF